MSKPIVLITDGDNLLHRAYHKFGGFTSQEGNPSSIIFGAPYLLRAMMVKVEPTKVVGVFDGGRDIERKKVLPGYKDREHREDFDYENFISQKNKVMGLFSYLGISVVWEKGKEADDLIYSLTRYYKAKGWYVVILSSDKDFHQLIDEDVSIFSPTKEAMITHKTYQRHLLYTPAHCVDWLIIDGDKSDKIPGYPGMGEKRIQAFFTQFNSIRAYLKSDVKGFMDREKLKTIYKRNRLLIDLAYFWKKFHKNLPIPWLYKDPIFNMIRVAHIAREYNVKTLLKPDFIKTFKDL